MTSKPLIYKETCPLCTNDGCNVYHRDSIPYRDYYHCSECDLIFVPVRFHLCSEEERKIYDQHNNLPDDPNYRGFLNKLYEPLSKHLAQGARGLDFGSGPGPTLSRMFEENGFSCAIYDKFYANEPDILTRDFDFVSTTEVVEHLSNPKDIFDQLFRLVHERDGVLGLMTKQHAQDPEHFATWHYKNDPTHISFYSKHTLAYLSEKYQKRLSLIGNDVALFTPLLEDESRTLSRPVGFDRSN